MFFVLSLDSNCCMYNELDKFHKIKQQQHLMDNKKNIYNKSTDKVKVLIFNLIFFNDLPVRSDASAMRKVLYDMRTNRADSNNGKSRTLVNLVNNAVIQPIVAPINNEKLNIPTKSLTAWKNASVSKPPEPV